MTGDHVTETLLEAYRRGEISSEVFQRRILRHLQSACEVCHTEIHRWQRRQLRASSDRLLRALFEEKVPPIGDEEEAEKDFKTLLSLAFQDREGKVDRALSRFRSPFLAQKLIQEALRELGHDPEETANLLKVAFAVLEHGPTSNFHREVRSYALAVKAMLIKLDGDLERTARLFEEARRIAPVSGIVDLAIAAELDFLEGAFLKDRRELVRAEEFLVRALKGYDILGDAFRQARAYLVLSAVRFHSQRFEEAIADSKRVLDLVPDHKGYAVLAAHNISLFLAESGHPEEAARRLKKYQPRYKEAESVWRTYDLHFHWLAGKISYGLGRYEQAELHLTRAREGLSERGTTYDTILACLDLALVYDATERYDDLMELTRMISGELASKSLHKESVAAVTLFLRAAAKRNLSRDLVREIARFLEFSRTDPTLKCEISLAQ